MENITLYEYVLLVSKHKSMQKQKNKLNQIDSIFRYDLMSRFYFLYKNTLIEENKKISFLNIELLNALSKTGTCPYLKDYLFRLKTLKKQREGKYLNTSEKHNEVLYPILTEMHRIDKSKIVDVVLDEQQLAKDTCYPFVNHKKNWQIIANEPYLIFKNGIYSLKNACFFILKNNEIMILMQKGSGDKEYYHLEKHPLENSIKKSDLETVYTNEYSAIITHLTSISKEELIRLSNLNYNKIMEDYKTKRKAA